MIPSVALVGHLGSGKSTAAKVLHDEFGHDRHSWAQGVRDIFSMAYDQITPENYADIKERVYTVSEYVDETSGRVMPVTYTGRELLQRIGTEAMRGQIDQDFWIKAGVKRLGRYHTVNDDTRFLNEAAALRERGFMIVRVVRLDVWSNDTHPSEVEQNQIEADVTIYNNAGIEEFAKVVKNLIDVPFQTAAYRAWASPAEVRHERLLWQDEDPNVPHEHPEK